MDLLIQTMTTMPYAIACAAACGVSIALFLLFSRFLPRAINAPGKRFKGSVALGWFVYFVLIISGYLNQAPLDFLDILAGASVLLSATILAFIFWSLIVWGFTLNMLLAITTQAKSANLDKWIACYLGEGDISRLTIDRIEILLATKLVELDGNQSYHLTSRGHLAAQLYRLVRGIFGISSHD